MSEENPEMREMAARICRDYLHGVWKHVTAENMTLKRIRLVSRLNIYYISQYFTVSLLTTDDTLFIRVYFLFRILRYRLLSSPVFARFPVVIYSHVRFKGENRDSDRS